MTLSSLARGAILLALIGLLAPSSSAQTGQPLEVGAALPLAARSMQNAGSGATSFSQAMGDQGLAVIFWSNTCPWVAKYESRIVALASEYEAAGVSFVAVNANDPGAYPEEGLAAMKQRVADEGYAFPYLVDEGSEAAKAFGASRTPQIFLFDAGGTLVYEGTVDDSPADPGQVEEQYFRDAMNQLIAGTDISVQKTNAFGCTIKFY